MTIHHILTTTFLLLRPTTTNTLLYTTKDLEGTSKEEFLLHRHVAEPKVKAKTPQQINTAFVCHSLLDFQLMSMNLKSMFQIKYAQFLPLPSICVTDKFHLL